jgi:hypothetical protein
MRRTEAQQQHDREADDDKRKPVIATGFEFVPDASDVANQARKLRAAEALRQC